MAFSKPYICWTETQWSQVLSVVGLNRWGCEDRGPVFTQVEEYGHISMMTQDLGLNKGWPLISIA